MPCHENGEEREVGGKKRARASCQRKRARMVPCCHAAMCACHGERRGRQATGEERERRLGFVFMLGREEEEERRREESSTKRNCPSNPKRKERGERLGRQNQSAMEAAVCVAKTRKEGKEGSAARTQTPSLQKCTNHVLKVKRERERGREEQPPKKCSEDARHKVCVCVRQKEGGKAVQKK